MTAPPETEASDLWNEFLQAGSETAFAELVRRHLNLVYSVALRRCGGDAALAQDASQTVFADLARKAPSLPRNLILAGWLYRHTAFVTSNLVRAEVRRRHRERTAMELHPPNEDADWSQIAPVLEDAMAELPERDRNALVLRFLDQQSFPDVGRSLGLSADAARMRVERALEGLRSRLARRGITSTTAALSLGFGQHGIVAAPVGLAATVATSATLAALTSTPSTLLALMASTKIQLGLAALVAAGASTGAFLEHRNNRFLTSELAAVRADLAAWETSAPAGDTVSPAELESLRQDRLRLMALRDEVGQLREDRRRLAQLEAENLALRQRQIDRTNATKEPTPDDNEVAKERALGLARMHFVKSWALALHLYASENDDTFPASFEEAARYAPKEPDSETPLFDLNQFELMYHGSFKAITHPAETILIRERETFTTTDPTTRKTRFNRTYAFADGHSEIHASPDGNFEEWERTRLFPAAAQALNPLGAAPSIEGAGSVPR